MKFNHFFSVLLFTFLIAACAPSKQTVRTSADITAEQQNEINDIITNMPASDSGEQQWLNTQLMEMAPASIHALIKKLGAPATGDDTHARYAVNGLAKHVSRPGVEANRSVYEQVIIQELKANYPAAVKSFLMEQLELVGTATSVPVLTSFLGDDLLNESAAQALRAINTSIAAEALLEGLSTTENSQQVALLKSLGDMKASFPELVDRVQSFADSTDSLLKESALYVLANSGQPSAFQTIFRHGNTHHQLTFAERLGEEENTAQAYQIARKLYDGNSAIQHKIAALYILAKQDQTGSTDLILEAAQDQHAELRSAALELARTMQGAEITNQFVELLEENSPAVQADIIEILGKRGDSSAWPTVKSYLGDESLEVRLAAINASVALGNNAANALISSMNSASQQSEINAIKTALLQLSSQSVYRSASQRWTGLSPQAKAALIEITGNRQSNEYLDELLMELGKMESSVRLATFRALAGMARTEDLPKILNLLDQARNNQETTLIQQAIVRVANTAADKEPEVATLINYINNPSDSKTISLIEILPEIGGQEALNAAVKATSIPNNDIQAAARQALAEWPDGSAIRPLQEVISSSPGSERSDLITGYIRIVENSMYTDADKVKFLTALKDETTNDQQKISLVTALSDMPSSASLKAVSEYFDEPNDVIREAALRAAAEILAPSYHFSDEFDGADKVLAVLEATTDSTTKQRIEEQIGAIQTQEDAAEGFTSLFNGEDLSGWTDATDAYIVQNGQLIHQEGESGNLFTEQEYSDFILRFQFKLSPGANNGLAIRSPLEGNPAYQAMELQILDNMAEKYENLEPYQYHGSVYGVAPAERGHLKQIGEWNTQEVIANGSRITVKLNGVTILDIDIEEAATPKTMDGKGHPGLSRSSGHIGFLGHGDEVAFRNIQIRDLNVYYPDYSTESGSEEGMNHPPEGFKALFNGLNLDGWKGLVANPEKRAEMNSTELAAAQEEADRVMQQHWSVRDGILFFDGKGESLTTAKDYKDFEMMLDWKIEPGGDSGVYLRGIPQVQIWDITEWPQGSGGLYNNQKNLSEPLVAADNPVGEWNQMRIKMIGDRVTVHLNGQLVVPNVVLENYWNRDKPIYPSGQIELQAHNTTLYFKNVFIREIPRTESLFNGESLSGWERVGGNAGSWNASNELLYTEGDGEEWEKGSGGGWLSTTEMYDNFKLELEYRLPEDGNSGVFLRAPREGDPAFNGLEIQLLDDYSDQYAGLEPWQYTGSIYDVKAPSKRVSKQAGEWQKMVIVADGPQIKVTLNDETIINTNLINHLKKVNEHPGLKRRKGYIGLQNHNSRVEFRNIRITDIK